ncbi:MAG: hypothetical protein QME45_14700 [Clostridiales bacterium]|nr:hypothetical protein [Clostridiales bacterium]
MRESLLKTYLHFQWIMLDFWELKGIYFKAEDGHIAMAIGIYRNKEENELANNFIKIAEVEIIPIFEQIGAKLTKKTPTEISFSFPKIELSFYLESEFEVYGVISSKELKQSVYLSEVMSDYFNIDEKVVYQISERISLELCIRKLVGIVTTKILPLIADGKIYEAMNIVMSKRKEDLHKYNESLIEKEAEKAFKEKRYEDVISYYAQMSELSDVQKNDWRSQRIK